MGFPHEPQTAEHHRTRWPLVVKRVWDFRGLTFDSAPPDLRPGLSRDHVLDFHDGLRLIVSNDLYDFGAFLHVSASPQWGSKAWHWETAKIEEKVQERLRFLSGQAFVLGYISPHGYPHFFYPALPAPLQPT